MRVLAIRDLRIQSGSALLIAGISLEITPGVPVILVGETGAGKSILLDAIMGTQSPDLTSSGVIELFGAPSLAADRQARHGFWGSQITLLPQEPWTALDPLMRCQPQVAEGFRKLRLFSNSSHARTKAAEQALQRLGLQHASRKLPNALSGGMAQRVAFAAARAGGASLLLADEPTKSLDADLRRSVAEILLQAVKEGGSLLTVTHDLAVARILGGQIAVLWNGQIVEQGPTVQVLQTPQHAYTKKLVASEPASWPVRRHPSPGPALLSANGISKSFGEHQIFRNLHIEIHAGERVAITGPSGSGKSTLGNVLLGLMPPDSGRVQRRKAGPRWKFQKLYQDPVVAFAPRIKLRRSLEDLARVHRLAWSDIGDSMASLRLNESLLNRLPEQISGGELQRFAILRTLLLRPQLLFADEPTSRLDPVVQQHVIDLLLESTAALNCALLVVTHDSEIANKVASRRITLGAHERSTPSKIQSQSELQLPR